MASALPIDGLTKPKSGNQAVQHLGLGEGADPTKYKFVFVGGFNFVGLFRPGTRGNGNSTKSILGERMYPVHRLGPPLSIHRQQLAYQRG